jgi:hypothetical protein
VVDSAVSSAAILVLVGFANAFGSILVSERIPQAIAAAVLSITDNKYLVILLINLLLLFVGMFMETIAALIILFVPLLALATGVGIDPLHFATFAVLNLMIGLTTPPVGVCLFICANIARLPLAPVVRAITPFLFTNIRAAGWCPMSRRWRPGCPLSLLGNEHDGNPRLPAAWTTRPARRNRIPLAALAGRSAGGAGGRWHLRVGPALLAGWRVRPDPGAGADHPWPRGGGHN